MDPALVEQERRPGFRREVAKTRELARIVGIPRRIVTPQDAVDLARELTELLKTPNGTQELRPFQALSLYELGTHGGLVCLGRVGAGKAQPNTEPVLAADGWKEIGSLRVGDRVYGSDGQLHTVLGVYPQGEREVYKITFSDRTWALCDLDHLWTFQVALRKYETKSLREWLEVPLFREAQTGKGSYKIRRLHLPCRAPVQYPEQVLPVDPYTLGALIGDGVLSQETVSFTSMDSDIVARLVVGDLVLKKTKSQSSGLATQYNITRGSCLGRRSNWLRKALDDLGLRGLSKDKRIPVQYLRSSVEQRLELLRGIFDTDGSVCRGATIDITLASQGLIEDVAEVVESLGGCATRYEKQLNYRGALRSYYRLHVSLPDGMVPFHCKRKQDPFVSKLALRQRKNPKRAVVRIEHAGVAPCTCISVSAPDQLYLTRFHVPTHNTLTTLLAPYVCESYRPLLLVPANLREKTRLDMRFYRPHWEIARNISVLSYEALSRKKQQHYLNITKPDLILCDEAHKLKSTQAAATKRLKRYLHENPGTKVAFLSGTLTNRSLKDYWHLVRWALPPEYVPMPLEYPELEMWALALDEKVQAGSRIRPGALEHLCNDEERTLFKKEPLRAVRRAYGRRLVDTPGIVSTKETFSGSALSINPMPLEVPKIVQDAFTLLRTDWMLPDGQPISDGHIAAKHAKELALGFFYKWDPRPPEVWLERRQAWCAFVRKTLAHNQRDLDTEEQVKDAVLQGLYERDVYDAWAEVRDTFEIRVVPVWLDDFALMAAADWMQNKGGIVWVYHTAFGHRLSKMTGVPYYGEGGFTKAGKYIEQHPAGKPLIASISANKEGKNLQAWNQNLITNPMSSGKWWEQVIGRTHREGQKEPEVVFDVFGSCLEHYQAYYRAVGDAIYVQDSTPQIQKLLFAESSMPSLADVECQPGVMWRPNKLVT
jgi:hypothetical protein